MLRMSWLLEEEKLLQINEPCEEEHMEKIACIFMFVNNKNYIEKIDKKIVDLDYNERDDLMVLTKSKLLSLIQEQKREFNNSRYFYKDAYMFNFTCCHDDFGEFDPKDSSSLVEYFDKIPLMEDVIIDPSIFLFHHLNALYFVFEEEYVPEPPELFVPKPILKLNTSKLEVANEEKRKKRVTIKINKHPNTTRKSWGRAPIAPNRSI